MQPIRIIDKQFNLYAEIDDYESLIWTRRWHKAGEFELHISVDKANTGQLQKGRIVVAGDKAAFILHREISVGENGEETILIKGTTIASMVGRRITVPPAGFAYDRVETTAEEAMKHYVDKNCVNPVDLRRKMPSLAIAPNLSRGPNIVHLSRLKALDAELEAISLSSGLGWDVILDTVSKQCIFETYEGRDLTAGQTVNPPVIFSVDFDAVKVQTFIDSDFGYRNTGYVGGQGEGEEREIIEVGTGLSGLERLETFIDARDIEDGDDLVSRGQQKLSEMGEIQTFDNEILTNGPYTYKEDWDLGDIVTAMNRKWDVTLDARITEVKEIYEPDGFKLEATFGNDVPTLVEKIKKVLDSPLVEKSNLSVENIPTKTSQLENDAGYITVSEAPQASTYIHTQLSPSQIWTVNHGLGLFPSVTVVDSAGSTVMGEVKYLSNNSVELSFSYVFSGKAYLN
ncbi:siphovirus ReqiPepy6 Gp37-like family protein [Desulfosporosinus sp.]|uniref:siphovirus ReqiPepy6 Gp37-like family protein n=1 Tax=Desulfosporosinus sp. TaxID=157907 RepID=UPI0025C2EEBF|nr:siphovirus ReqiPepy6 Gp37-like family protein [Desulfosporosinus sp.]MBC2722348.1 siphovirus ReqiPepy6 Gp37-like family protein [Desulfosporosinus sp.]MBC2728618.1 siphovirus ReqiPepy6 Gp37-like family protein [Desulfosporosinus sp.]